MASRPVAASPHISQSGLALCRMARVPCLTTSWSSTIKILAIDLLSLTYFLASRFERARDACSHGGTLVRKQLQPSPKRAQPFAHSSHADPGIKNPSATELENARWQPFAGVRNL